MRIPVAGLIHRHPLRHVARKAYPTSTRTSDHRLVPWLAAEGPLAYTPESPPVRDTLFQYGWVLPQVCRPGLRRHLYFGAGAREHARVLFEFWDRARRGIVERVLVQHGRLDAGNLEAPIGVYRHAEPLGDRHYFLIQHGSYQYVPVDEQPELEAGRVLLHRGIGDEKVFRWHAGEARRDAESKSAWTAYARLQFEILSRSDLSFNSIHDRTKRAETSHLLDGTWLTDDLAAQHGLDVENDRPTRALWSATHQSFALRSWVSTSKFGPNRVVCRTPISNIRITTFFAGEHEVRVIDPARVEVLDAIGCVVVPDS
jgi:hypothetical protein